MKHDEYVRLLERARLEDEHARTPVTKEAWQAWRRRKQQRRARLAFAAAQALLAVVACRQAFAHHDPQLAVCGAMCAVNVLMWFREPKA